MIKALLTGLLLLIITSPSFAQGSESQSDALQGDALKGKALITVCAACHGQDGNSQINLFPKLAGQKENYLLKQLKDIQSGKRKVPQMTGMLDPLTRQNLSDIAAYFAKQKSTVGKAKPDLVEQGEALFRFGDPSHAIPACASCHGPAGQGINSAKYPALSGQFSQYTRSQLHAFKSGGRTNDANKLMQTIATKLSDQQMDAVASYLEGLKEAN